MDAAGCLRDRAQAAVSQCSLLPRWLLSSRVDLNHIENFINAADATKSISFVI